MKQPLVVAVALACVVALVPGTPAGADVIRDDEWHLRYLNVAEANEKTRGEGVTVAIVDGGVDRDHDDLAGAVLDPVFVKSSDTLAASGVDADGHGTALAGAVAGQGHGPDRADGVIGVAPGARILPVVIPMPADPAAGVDPDQLAAGIELATANRAKVIVVGYSVAGSERLMQAVRDAQEADAIVVAADGDQPTRDFEPYPAAYAGVLAAIPLTRGGDVRVQSTSGRASGLGVPGFQIMTTNTGNRYRVDDGSASPGLLAGVVALLRAAYPGALAGEIVRRLTLTAVDVGPSGPDRENGLGRVDLVPALTKRIAQPSPSPSPGASSLSAGAGAGADATASAEPAVALPPRSRGQNGWLLGLPLLVVIALLVLYAVRGERRIRVSSTDGIDSVGAPS